MNRVNQRSAGFTIVELLMAMAFVSMLLIVITLTVIQISSIYNKGLTMRAVDQAGRTISTDIRQTLSQSQPFNEDMAFFLQSSNGGETKNPADAMGGRLCTGVYTYVWNFGKALNSPVNIYQDGDRQIRFVRVNDNGALYCANLGTAINTTDAANPTEFLSGENANLAVQSFEIKKIASDNAIGQALYRVILQVGTNDQSALLQEQKLDTMDISCRPPSDDASLQNYCAVNRFDFTAQAGNKGVQQ